MSEIIKPEKKDKEEKEGWLYRAARILGSLLFHTIIPVRYYNAERMEQVNAPYIAIANHSSLLDPIAVAYAERRHFIHFMGKKELTETPILKHLVKGLHMIPVDRHNTDMAAMRSSVQALRKGGILGIFPEGTRHHQGLMEELESGLAMIALRSGVPVLPMYIEPKLRLFHRSRVWIGEPIETADLREQGIDRDTCSALLTRITATYAQMAQDAQTALKK